MLPFAPKKMTKPKPLEEVGVEITDAKRKTLRVLRKKKGWSMEEAGRRSGLSDGTISNLENGRQTTLKKRKYARLMHAYSSPEPVHDEIDGAQSTYVRIVDLAASFDENQLQVLLSTAESLAKTKHT